VIPMIIQIFTLPLYYRSLLGGRPGNVIMLAGVLMLCAALAVLRVKVDARQSASGTKENNDDNGRIRGGAG
jgi:maltose/moltooligosaccharide transporter